MPARNTIRLYTSDTYYHIYNRGVEKRIVFQDVSDYKMFLYYLFVYLAPKDIVEKTYPDLKIALRNGNFFNKVTLHSYVLMPNHFHLLAHQTEKEYLTKFMRRITNAYTTYFNSKYERVGSLFQGVFKCANIETYEYLLQLSKYIHLNPIPILHPSQKIEDYLWSSYRIYLKLQKTSYIHSSFILNFFSKLIIFLAINHSLKQMRSLLYLKST